MLAAYAHADQPFEQLVEALHPERHASYSPLFQVMLVLQNMPLGELELPGLALRPVETGTGAARFDLSVEVTERDGELELDFEYDSDLFDAATVARLARHYVRLLEQLATEADQPVGRLQLLSAAERDARDLRPQRHRLARRRPGRTWWRGSGPPPPATRTGPRCATAPSSWTTPACSGRVDRLAAALAARGVRPDQLVGLHAGRTVDLAVGILAILRAGAGYLPLDPSLPADRLAGMVADARPALVLTDATSPAPAGLAAAGRHRGRRSRRPARRRSPSGPANLAYTIYTSGSTGRPKGVAVSHASITNLLDHWLARMGPLPTMPGRRCGRPSASTSRCRRSCCR